MAEVYAGFLLHTDHEIGRLLDFLEESGELENTIVVFVSDNGASGEGGPNGSVNENKFFNGIPDTIEENLPYLDELGSPATYNHYPVGWAWAFNTPFKMWKRYNFEGGVADPMVISWPKGIAAKGELRHQFLHATDIAPTIYDCLGVELPEVVKGFPQVPLEGVSFRSTFESDDVPTPKETGFFSMLGSRAIWHKGWKAVSVHPTIAGWGHFEHDRWELYDTDEDPTESHDLASEHPEKVQELVNLWFHEAGKYNGFRSSTRRRSRSWPTRPGPRLRRPATVTSTTRARPRCPRRRRSTSATAATASPSRPNRVGGRLGRALLARRPLRRTFPLRQGREAEVRLQLRGRQRAAGRVDEGDPDGRVILGASFVREGDSMPTTGTLSLFVDDEKVGEGPIMTQPGNFSLVGEGLNVGKDPGEAVVATMGTRPQSSQAAPSRRRSRCPGRPLVDLELEALAMMKRESPGSQGPVSPSPAARCSGSRCGRSTCRPPPPGAPRVDSAGSSWERTGASRP